MRAGDWGLETGGQSACSTSADLSRVAFLESQFSCATSGPQSPVPNPRGEKR